MRIRRKHLPGLLLTVLLVLIAAAPVSVHAATVSNSTRIAFRQLEKQYKHAKKGGIALVGSSSLAQWKTAGEDFSASGKYKASQICNFGISSATFEELLDSKYITLVASKKPRVVVIYGANDLKHYATEAVRNKEVINLAVDTRILFLEKLKAALQKRGVRKPKFYLVSTVKTPRQYKMCKQKTKSCNIWDRADAFNSYMKHYAKVTEGCTYINLEQYFYYKDKSGQLCFYRSKTKLRDKSKNATAKQLLAKKRSDPWFLSDLNHPSKLAYEKIWRKMVRTILK